MIKTGSARIINVSSRAHDRMIFFAFTKVKDLIILFHFAYLDFSINWDDINLSKKYNPIIAYSQSKIANILFSRELANKHGGK